MSDAERPNAAVPAVDEPNETNKQDVEPADIGELVQRRRLQEIFTARQHFINTRSNLTDRQLEGHAGYSKTKEKTALRTCIEEYTMVVEPMFDAAEDPEHWRKEVQLGKIDVQGVNHEPLTVNGFVTLLDTTWPLTFEREIEQHDELRGTVTETESVQAELPASVSHTAFRKLNEFVRDHGVKFRTEEGGRPFANYSG